MTVIDFRYTEPDKPLKKFSSEINVCVTGVFKNTRQIIQNTLSSAGYTIHSNVNSKTDFLITGDNPGSSKLNLAEKYKTKIVTRSDFQHIHNTNSTHRFLISI